MGTGWITSSVGPHHLFGIVLSLFRPAVQAIQLHIKHGRLDSIQPKIPANDPVIILGLTPMDPEDLDLFRELGIIGDHHATISQRSEILAREERVAAQISHAARPQAIRIFSADRLGCVLNHSESVLPRHLYNRVHLGALPIEMDRKKGFGLGGYGLFDFLCIDVVSQRGYIDKDRLCPDSRYDASRGENE